MIAASNSWICGFDNLSYIPPWLSDAFCSLATGGGFATRTLYSDDDETILVAERPILLNGIEDPGLRSDLVDRSLTPTLPVIESDKRKAEDEFWREFDEAWPRILGAYLDAVAVALQVLPNVKSRGGQWPRMKDFAEWATAAEMGLGLEPGEFLRAYTDNIESANQAVLETSPVVKALFERLQIRKGKIEGLTATQLLVDLSIVGDTKAKAWPKAAHVLSGMLTRIAPNLRKAGITITPGYRGKDRIWTIYSSGSVGSNGRGEKARPKSPAQADASEAPRVDADATPTQRRLPKTPEKQGKPELPTLPKQKSGPNLKPSPKPFRG